MPQATNSESGILEDQQEMVAASQCGVAALYGQMEHAKECAGLRVPELESVIQRFVGPAVGSGLGLVYQQTESIIASCISDLVRSNRSILAVSSAYDLFLKLERPLGFTTSRAVLLAKAIPRRSKLIELSSKLSCRDAIWRALEEDDRYVLMMLRQAVFYDRGEIMELREDDAASFLTLVDSVLYASGFGRGIFSRQIDFPAPDAEIQAFRGQLHRISVRLSMASFQLPEGLYLTGVTLKDARQVTGGYADIHRGQYRARHVALKTMRVCTRQMSKCLKMFCREITLLHSLSHPNICELVGVDRELFGGHFCLVTDWMPYGNIMDFIEAYLFVLDEIKRFVVEIASALAYLHSKNVVHGDLHVNNILIDATRHVRLADFGLSDFSDASSASVSSAATGAVRYMAPEILSPEDYALQHVRHTPQSDVHSFAMCIWAIFNGDSPFHSCPAFAASMAICRGKRPARDTARHDLPEPLWVLLTRCWQDKARDRPSSSDLYHELSHMFSPHSTADAHGRASATSSELAGPSHPCREASNPEDEAAPSSQPESDDSTLGTRTTPKSRRISHFAKTSFVSKSQPPHTSRSPISPAAMLSPAPQTVPNLASVYPGAERLIPHVSEVHDSTNIVARLRALVGLHSSSCHHHSDRPGEVHQSLHANISQRIVDKVFEIWYALADGARCHHIFRPRASRPTARGRAGLAGPLPGAPNGTFGSLAYTSGS